jgi:hypothetical protein
MNGFFLQAKKMKPVFAKWLDFERIHGTEEQQNEVRRTALAFLHAKADALDSSGAPAAGD